MNGRERPPEWPVKPAPAADERAAAEHSERVRRSRRGAASAVNWKTLALIGGLLLLVLVIGYFATRGNPDQDKLTANESGTQTAAAADPEKLCAKKTTYDLIKRELFRRAAQLRGSDQIAFDQLSSYAVLRMENPVMESEDKPTSAVNCSGSLSLDLPPGVTVVGGRHTLTSDVDYTIQPAADGTGNVVLLRNADAIIAPLATLARANQKAAPQPQLAAPQMPVSPVSPPSQPAPQAQPAAPRPRPPLPETRPPPQRSQEPPAAVPTNAHPSFDCRKARTKGERAVCSDAGLAALDRNMSAQYVRAISGASPEQQAQLRRTRDRFLAYRDRCPNRSCMGDAYVGRMREIRDIMEGTWHPR